MAESPGTSLIDEDTSPAPSPANTTAVAVQPVLLQDPDNAPPPSPAGRAASVLRLLLEGGEPLNSDREADYGTFNEAMAMLFSAYDQGGTPMVLTVYQTLSKVNDSLKTLLASDGSMSGVTDQAIAILTAGRFKKGRVPLLPNIDAARTLSELAPFISKVMNATGIQARAKHMAIAHVVHSLFLNQGRLLYDDNAPQGSLQRIFLITEQQDILPVSAAPTAMTPETRAYLQQAGINGSEALFRWVVTDLEGVGFNDQRVRHVPLRKFWWRDSSDETRPIIYYSSGPRWIIKVYRDESGVIRLDKVPNGHDDVFFVHRFTIPEWTPSPDPMPLNELQVFNPNFQTPPEAPAYTEEVQRKLLEAWLIAVLADIRPLPILVAIGDKGGGKSNLIRGVVSLLIQGGISVLSDDVRNILTLVTTAPVVGIDNLDSAPPKWFADILAAVTTGMHFQRRILYTDNSKKDVPINVALCLSSRTARFARSDIAERLVPIMTGQFADGRRESDIEMREQVRILRDNALTWLVMQAIELLEKIPYAPRQLPGRFIDFNRVVWAYDSDHAAAYLLAMLQAQALAVGNSDVLIMAIIEHFEAIADDGSFWKGTPKQLTTALNDAGAELPYLGGGKAIAQRLREAMATLSLYGIDVTTSKSGNATIYRLSYMNKQTDGK